MSNFERLKSDVMEKKFPILITISGLSCSGKTTLASHLYLKFLEYRPSVIQQDDYYKDLKDIPNDSQGYRNMESVQAFHCNELTSDVRMLLDGNDILIPSYNILSNKRISKTKKLKPSKIIIAEGLHTILLLKDIDRPVNHYSIFMNTARVVCLTRRVNRDTRLLRVQPDKISNYFMNIVIPNYKKYHDEMIETADEVITDGYC